MSKIIIYVYEDKSLLYFGDIVTYAYIGKNGVTFNKREGDYKTPLGNFSLGVSLGTHEHVDTKLPYVRIDEELYWVSDVNSKYYNKLVNKNEVIKDWNLAEHLIEYSKQYEYAIEIKTNPHNIKGLGSAIFLHCIGDKKYTAGCIAIPRDIMFKILTLVDKNTKIIIKKMY